MSVSDKRRILFYNRRVKLKPYGSTVFNFKIACNKLSAKNDYQEFVIWFTNNLFRYKINIECRFVIGSERLKLRPRVNLNQLRVQEGNNFLIKGKQSKTERKEEEIKKGEDFLESLLVNQQKDGEEIVDKIFENVSGKTDKRISDEDDIQFKQFLADSARGKGHLKKGYIRIPRNSRSFDQEKVEETIKETERRLLSVQRQEEVDRSLSKKPSVVNREGDFEIQRSIKKKPSIINREGEFEIRRSIKKKPSIINREGEFEIRRSIKKKVSIVQKESGFEINRSVNKKPSVINREGGFEIQRSVNKKPSIINRESGFEIQRSVNKKPSIINRESGFEIQRSIIKKPSIVHREGDFQIQRSIIKKPSIINRESGFEIQRSINKKPSIVHREGEFEINRSINKKPSIVNREGEFEINRSIIKKKPSVIDNTLSLKIDSERLKVPFLVESQEFINILTPRKILTKSLAIDLFIASSQKSKTFPSKEIKFENIANNFEIYGDRSQIEELQEKLTEMESFSLTRPKSPFAAQTQERA